MEHKDLVEASNEYHESFCEYIEENGFDESVKMEAESKIQWLLLMARRHGVTLDING